MKLRARFSYVTPRYSKTFFPVSSLVYFLSFGPRPRKDDRAVIIQKGRFPHQTGEQTQQCFIRVHLFDVRAPCACVVKTPNFLLRRCRDLCSLVVHIVISWIKPFNPEICVFENLSSGLILYPLSSYPVTSILWSNLKEQFLAYCLRTNNKLS